MTDGVGGTDAVLGVGVTVSGLLPVDAQAERTAEAAAIENVRRDKRGDDGFIEFSSDGADAQAKGRLKPGMKIVLSAFGVGLSWGSAVLEWS